MFLCRLEYNSRFVGLRGWGVRGRAPNIQIKIFYLFVCDAQPVPVAARSKVQVFGRSPAEIVASNPTGGMDICLL
jgi:hypothetical protein